MVTSFPCRAEGNPRDESQCAKTSAIFMLPNNYVSNVFTFLPSHKTDLTFPLVCFLTESGVFILVLSEQLSGYIGGLGEKIDTKLGLLRRWLRRQWRLLDLWMYSDSYLATLQPRCFAPP